MGERIQEGRQSRRKAGDDGREQEEVQRGEEEGGRTFKKETILERTKRRIAEKERIKKLWEDSKKKGSEELKKIERKNKAEMFLYNKGIKR